MSRPLSILMFGDRKPGHENQSLGLIDALGRRTEIHTDRISVERGAIRSLFKTKAPERQPDLIVGAGHATHAPMLKLSCQLDTPCVLLMKPSLPAALFDLCIIPEHDAHKRQPDPNVIITKGALNRVPPPKQAERHGGLILLGGPSKSHGWESESVLKSVCRIVESCAQRPWRVTDSRRTPQGELDALINRCPAIAAYPHETTGPDWLPQRLSEAAEVWVSEDSVSMIYESLSSGARVGLLAAPYSRETRVTRGVEKLIEDHWVTRFVDWIPGEPLPPPPRVLQESDRCAEIVMQRFFPDRLSKR